MGLGFPYRGVPGNKALLILLWVSKLAVPNPFRRVRTIPWVTFTLLGPRLVPGSNNFFMAFHSCSGFNKPFFPLPQLNTHRVYPFYREIIPREFLWRVLSFTTVWSPRNRMSRQYARGDKVPE